MTAALQLINALISLMAMADRLGVNLDGVKAKFDQARAEERDVTSEEIDEMAAAAADSEKGLESLIATLPTSEGEPE